MNRMPAYAVFHKSAFLGLVSAVSHAQATARAEAKFPGKRLAVELSGTPRIMRLDHVNCNRAYQAKRAPYATGDFEARRAAAIAAYLNA